MYSTQYLRIYVRVLSNNALGAGVVRGESVELRTHSPASNGTTYVEYIELVRAYN
jgi:hypothetical protein